LAAAGAQNLVRATNTCPPDGHDFSAPIRVLVADSNEMGSELLSSALNKFRNIQVLRCAVNQSAVMASLEEQSPEILLISPNLEDGPTAGFSVLRHLRASHSTVKAIALLESSKRERVVEAFWSGAQGVFSKTGSIKTLGKCITSVQAGQIWANSQQLRLVLEALAHSVPPRLVDAKGADILTQREQDVVSCLAAGMSNREVAKRLKLSEHTVKNYLLHIFDKLGVSSRVEVVLYASGQRMLAKNPDPNPELEDDLPTDDASLLTSYRQAARQGFPVSQFRLGSIYREGRGQPSDPISAYVWFELARVTSEKLQQKSKDAKDHVAGDLTEEQLAEAHRRISGWLRLFD
jgi:DNA-binding NarL/FixJ family response regulator